MNIFRSTSSKELPGSRAAKVKRPPSYTSSRFSANNDTKTTIIVGSNCPCHARYEAMKARIDDLAKRHNKTSSAQPWEQARLSALLGIISAPAENCAIACCCHDELQILEAELKRQGMEHEQIRSEMRHKSTAEKRSFETYAGEVRFLNGMLRECKGQTKPAEPSVDMTGALRSSIQRLEVKVEVLKNRVRELELKAEM